jgi:HD-GYP domain-containing protein (c-di-GMP phosphodiesterase class II)
MGLSEEETTTIRLAGSIHDVGKLSVPVELLSRPGRLSDTELHLIKAHPQSGYDILKRIELPWPIAEITLQHHERMDGSGYPFGLKGNTILIGARVLAVADVVEAMAFHRPYRPSLGVDNALEEIRANRGILYDSNVVDACLRAFRGKRFAFE